MPFNIADKTSLTLKYNEMVADNLSRLKAIARSYSGVNGNIESREDLLQEMLFQLWRGLPYFKGKSQLDTWVYRVALNTAITYVRSRDKKPNLVTDADVFINTKSGSYELDEMSDILEKFLDILNEIDKAIMMLYLDDIDQKQIAEITGLTVNVIAVRINRMKKRFKQLHIGD